MEKIIAIIQARTSSTRLPNKVLMKLDNKTVIENIVDRVNRSKAINTTIVATSTEEADDRIEELLKKQKINCFRGSLNNVLERFYYCAKEYGADVIIRLTADNTLIDSELIDEAVDVFMEKRVDYLYYKKSLPVGMCIEIFTFESLKTAFEKATNPECLEHVTPYIRNNPKIFNVLSYECDTDEDHSNLRFTMDTEQDYNFVKHIYDYFSSNDFNYTMVLEVLKKHPEWLQLNDNVVQNTVKYSGE